MQYLNTNTGEPPALPGARHTGTQKSGYILLDISASKKVADKLTYMKVLPIWVLPHRHKKRPYYRENDNRVSKKKAGSDLLSHSLNCSTIGARDLNCRVR